VQTLVALASRPIRKCLFLHLLSSTPKDCSQSAGCTGGNFCLPVGFHSKGTELTVEVELRRWWHQIPNLHQPYILHSNYVCVRQSKILTKSSVFCTTSFTGCPQWLYHLLVLQALHNGSIAYWCYRLSTVALSPIGVKGSPQWLYRLLVLKALHSGSIAYWCYRLSAMALSPIGVTGSPQWLYSLLVLQALHSGFIAH